MSYFMIKIFRPKLVPRFYGLDERLETIEEFETRVNEFLNKLEMPKVENFVSMSGKITIIIRYVK